MLILLIKILISAILENFKIAIMINASDFDLSKNYKKHISKYILKRKIQNIHY